MNIYVSNLSFQTQEEDLTNLFSQFGTVSAARIITDRETNRSRGFAFVEMADDTEAKAALQGLNNKEVDGRALSVSEARPKEDRNSGGGYGGGRKKW